MSVYSYRVYTVMRGRRNSYVAHFSYECIHFLATYIVYTACFQLHFTVTVRLAPIMPA